MLKIILIGFAGFAGTLARYWLSGATSGRRQGETFPFSTLAVNVAGCFLVGLLFYLLQERQAASHTTRAVVFVGLLGGFTTFSSYGLQTLALLQEGRVAYAILNVALSNVLGVGMVWVGYTLGATLEGAFGG